MILISIPKHVLRSHFAVPRMLCLCFLLIAVISCAVLPKPPAETSRGEWGSVVITPARFTPASNFEAFAIGKTKGAAKGATMGAGLGVAGTAALAVTGGPLAVVIAPYLAVTMVPALATGMGVLGGAASVTVDEAQAIDAMIQQNLKALHIQITLAELVAESVSNDTGQALSINKNVGPSAIKTKGDYSELSRIGFGGVLEIAATDVGFEGAGKKLRFFMVVRARMIRPGDGEQLYDRKFVYESDPYEGICWAAKNAALFEAELHRAYASIAESIVEQVFLLTALPLETNYRDPYQKIRHILSIGDDQACGLAWRLPPREYFPTIFSDRSRTNWNRFPVVATRMPTLEWEPFPRVIDQHTRYEPLLNTVSNIRYDLRIWKVVIDTPPQLVYERRALTVPTHTLDQPLESGTRYFWSIRARFDVNGKTRATRWGCYRTPNYSVGNTHVKPQIIGWPMVAEDFRDPCTMDFIPTVLYYRFKTP
jgi:hypothetical protein